MSHRPLILCAAASIAIGLPTFGLLTTYELRDRASSERGNCETLNASIDALRRVVVLSFAPRSGLTLDDLASREVRLREVLEIIPTPRDCG